MSIATLALILASVTISATAQLCFKSGVSSAAGALSVWTLLKPGVLGGLALYGCGTLLWLAVLSRIDVSQAYPFVGLGFVLTTLFGWLMFGEIVGPVRLAGTLLVVGGVVLIGRT